MIYNPPTRQRGMEIARKLKRKLSEKNVPVVNVFLFGSLATNKTHKWSDVDIAVIYHPFKNNIILEREIIRDLQEDHDVPVDVLCFRPEDLENRFLGIAQEVKRHGIPV